jgi:thioesterase domain-containing protein/acyl carrier protein
MVPAAFVQLDSLPLSPNGKVDRRALPAPELPAAGQAAGADSRPRTPLEATLAGIWAEVLGVPAVGIHDNFFALGGHSLLGIQLFARMEQELGQRLPLALLFQAPTVAQLAAQIDLPASSQAWQTLIPIQAEGRRPPFFCVHGFGGGVVGYADLAHLLPADQPFYGLQAAGLDGHEPPDTTIEAMAARYVTALRDRQPHGPYTLGGYCLGGVIAFEMARQLEAAGEAVALLAVMEGSAPQRYHERTSVIHPRRALAIWRNLPYWLEDYRKLGVAGLRQQARRKLRVWRKRLLRRLGQPQETEPQDVVADDLSVVPQHHMEILRLQVRAMHAYEPQPYGGAVTLFVAKGATVTKALFGSLDTASGWQKLARGGVQVRLVDGGHRNIHMQPYVPSLARELADALRAAQER